ncbi:hypothetical protein CBR_g41721 [Chara braunii]|uniref:Vacuolar ATPase assembly protein VMA22 n=1 Tax=Chara braunii TaxID=69332 RepID=A0A388LWR8_CHABU|nr:hypothetical protein CBR_g41721 [Chara braunii]|eukprot:GBG86659.1 hypothetical protein CBR_g41721 [Chara braunii]
MGMYEMSDMAVGPVGHRAPGDDDEFDNNHGDSGNETTSASIAPSGFLSEEEVVPGPVTIRERKEEAFLECMEALEDLLAARQGLATSMRSGFFNVAQARYAMGPSRVGRLQYDSRDISATALVDIVGGRTSQEDPEDGDGIATPRFVLQTRGPCRTVQDERPSDDSRNEEHSGEGRKQEQGLRQRKGKGAANSGISEDAGTDEGEALNALAAERPGGGSRPGGNLSPLNWFGALVSPHLRSAQVEFSQALSHAVRVANASARAERARAQFLALGCSRVARGGCGSAGEGGETASRTEPGNSRNLTEISTCEKHGTSVAIESRTVIDHSLSARGRSVSEPFDERMEASEIQVADYRSNAGRVKASLMPASIVEELAQKYGL